MSELFGTPSGFRTYDKDQAELGLLASQTEHQKALSELNRAQASTMLGKQKTEEDLLRMAAGQGPQAQTVDEISKQLLAQAGLRAKIGQFKEAGDILKDLAQVNSATSTAKAADARAASGELAAHLKRLEAIRNRLAAVKSPADHATALMQLQADPEIGKALPDWLKTYNPQAIKGYVAGSKAEIDRIKLEIDQAELKMKQGEAASRTSTRAAALALNERRTAAYETRPDAVEKAGGTALATPKASEVKAMEGALKAAGYAISDKAELAVQATELADRALQLRAQRPALTQTEAQAFAIKEAVEAGELKSERTGVPDFLGGAAKFSPQAGAATRPLPMPPSLDKAVVGKHYRAPNGSLVRYKGNNNFEVVVAPMRAKKGPTLPPLEADDGEEE